MTRICILRRDYYPQSPHVSRDARALLSEGFEVDVVSLRKPGEKASEEVDGVQVYRLPLTKHRGGVLWYLLEYSWFFIMAFAVLTVLHLKRRYSVIEVDTMPDFLVFAALIPKLTGSKVILYLFECMPELFEHGYDLSPRHPVVRMLRFIESRASRFADHVIYCGPGYRAIQEPRAARPIEGTVVLNVPEESIFSPDKSTPPRLSFEDRAFRVMTHGSLLERYGVSTLIRAVPLLIHDIPNLEVRIVGDDEYRPVLEALTRELGVESYVTFVGRVPLEEVPELIEQADVGVATFLHDCGLAWKLFEYMSMQRPVVHSATGFTMDFCSNDEVMFFKPGDERELADRLLSLYRNPEEGAKMVERANQLYQTCSWNVMREDYLDVYRKLTNGRSNGHLKAPQDKRSDAVEEVLR